MRRFKMFVVFAVIVGMLSLGIAAFAQNQPPYSTTVKDIKIFFIVKSSESLYWQIVMAGAALAGKQLGLTITFQEAAAESDVSRQIAIMDTAIAEHPNAIVLAPTVADSLVPDIEKAMSDGIKVILIDSAANTTDYNAFVATDNVAAGKALAKEFVDLIKAKTGQATPTGDIAYMTEMAGVGSLLQRDQGFLEGLKEYGPGLKIVAHQYAQDSVDIAMQNFENIFTAHPNLVGVFADNEVCGDGLIRAIPASGLTGKIVAVSFDSDPALIDALKNGVIQALQVQQPWEIGYYSIFYAVNAIEGVYVPFFVNTPANVITQANMNTPASQATLDPLTFYKSLLNAYGITPGK
ncbi:MAG: ABC transporter substrate-binding protein [Caldisericum sp.]|uniref:ABC transporter substrate-binding protein n=1 Tax=Caldisericum sp. TaxID=2499687 RepID=UPI003D13011E